MQRLGEMPWEWGLRRTFQSTYSRCFSLVLLLKRVYFRGLAYAEYGGDADPFLVLSLNPETSLVWVERT